MSSQYLKCDHCNATIGAEEVAKHSTPTFGDTPDLIAYAKELGWELSDGDDRCPWCADRLFTYDDEDVKRVLDDAAGPSLRRLAELAFEYAAQAGGFTRGEFTEVHRLTCSTPLSQYHPSMAHKPCEQVEQVEK